MQLQKNRAQSIRYRQSEMCHILKQRHAFVGQIKENDCRSHHAAFADDICVEQTADADQNENKHLLENATETDFSQFVGQFMLNRNYAKQPAGLFARVISKIASFTTLQYVNYLLGSPIGHVKYALD